MLLDFLITSLLTTFDFNISGAVVTSLLGALGARAFLRLGVLGLLEMLGVSGGSLVTLSQVEEAWTLPLISIWDFLDEILEDVEAKVVVLPLEAFGEVFLLFKSIESVDGLLETGEVKDILGELTPLLEVVEDGSWLLDAFGVLELLLESVWALTSPFVVLGDKILLCRVGGVGLGEGLVRIAFFK